VTAIMRVERFCYEAIARAIVDGTLDAVLRRLSRWFEEEHPAGRVGLDLPFSRVRKGGHCRSHCGEPDCAMVSLGSRPAGSARTVVRPASAYLK
jgi:hypothetical protein